MHKNDTAKPAKKKYPQVAPFSYRIPADLADLKKEAEDRKIGIGTVITERLRRLKVIEITAQEINSNNLKQLA